MKNKLFLGLGTFISLIGLSQIMFWRQAANPVLSLLVPSFPLHGASLSYVCFYV